MENKNIIEGVAMKNCFRVFPNADFADDRYEEKRLIIASSTEVDESKIYGLLTVH